jgi:hypothetical protein
VYRDTCRFKSEQLALRLAPGMGQIQLQVRPREDPVEQAMIMRRNEASEKDDTNEKTCQEVVRRRDQQQARATDLVSTPRSRAYPSIHNGHLILTNTLQGSNSSRLLRRWMATAGALNDSFQFPFVLGNWELYVPERIGNSVALDTSLDSIMKAVVCFRNRTDENVSCVEKSILRSMTAIRRTIENGDRDLLYNEVLMSIGIMHLVEVISEVPPFSNHPPLAVTKLHPI